MMGAQKWTVLGPTGLFQYLAKADWPSLATAPEAVDCVRRWNCERKTGRCEDWRNVEVVEEAEVLKARENERVADMVATGCSAVVDRSMQSNKRQLGQLVGGVSVRGEYTVKVWRATGCHGESRPSLTQP